MCDVLFASYLRHLDNKHMFVFIPIKLYNYNEHNNSITGKICVKNLEIYLKKTEHNFEIFIKNFNEHIEKNIDGFYSNFFISYTMLKKSFEYILKDSLKENYKYKEHINKNLLENLKLEYDKIKNLCD